MSSDTTFPFAPPQAPEDNDGDAPEKGSRTALLVLVAIGVAAVLALGGWFLFVAGGDDGDLAAQPAVPHRPAAAPKVPAQPPAAPKAAAKPAAPVAEPAVRNPFKTLLPAAPAPATAPVGGTGTSTTGGTTTGGSTSTGSVPAPAPAATTAPAPTVMKPALPAAKTPISFRLVNVQESNSSAKMIVGGTTYNAKVGQAFAKYFKVLRLQNGSCGAFRYSSQTFYLCEGGTARMK
jgi:hypothetical protein